MATNNIHDIAHSVHKALPIAQELHDDLMNQDLREPIDIDDLRRLQAKGMTVLDELREIDRIFDGLSLGSSRKPVEEPLLARIEALAMLMVRNDGGVDEPDTKTLGMMLSQYVCEIREKLKP